MATERFSKAEFEAALPQPWMPYSFTGEQAYVVRLDGIAGVAVVSSIDSTGYASDIGESSIRCWLVYQEYDESGRPFWKILGTKVCRWTTRVPGWQKRMNDVIDTLRGWRTTSGNCPKCREPKHIFRTKNGLNKGRVFAKCMTCNNGFVWLTEAEE